MTKKMMSFELAVQKLLVGKSLSEAMSRDVFLKLFKQGLSLEQSRTLLLLLAHKGETAAELWGCIQALQQLEKPRRISRTHLVDTCGTGGDKSHTINVSTLSAIVVAGAGGYVAKHGNRAITSKTGSSDLMQALGVRLDARPSKMIQALKECGLAYFHAPFYHPVFAKVQPLRQKIKEKTIFNLMGPLVNPFVLSGQVIGVSSKENLALFAGVLRERSLDRAIVCHSQDGMDEISTAKNSDIAFIQKKKVRYKTICPKDFGFKKTKKSDYAGGSVKRNHEIALKFLRGKLKGPKRDLILINAAAGIYVAGLAKNLENGFDLAVESVDKGKALKVIHRLVSITNGR